MYAHGFASPAPRNIYQRSHSSGRQLRQCHGGQVQKLVFPVLVRPFLIRKHILFYLCLLKTITNHLELLLTKQVVLGTYYCNIYDSFSYMSHAHVVLLVNMYEVVHFGVLGTVVRFQAYRLIKQIKVGLLKAFFQQVGLGYRINVKCMYRIQNTIFLYRNVE